MKKNVRALLCLIAFASASAVGCLTSTEDSTSPRSLSASDGERNGKVAGDEASKAGPTPGAGKGAAPSPVANRCDFSRPPAPAEARGDEGERACRCTRRPGPGESIKCPPGADQSVTARIGPEGGVLELSGTASTKGVSVRLEIPPKALSEIVSLRLTETSIAPPAGFIDWSPVYRLEPDGVTFTRPAALRVPWNSNDGAVDVDLALYASTEADACALVPLADSYVNAGFNQGSLRQTGWLMVGRPRTAAESTCP